MTTILMNRSSNIGTFYAGAVYLLPRLFDEVVKVVHGGWLDGLKYHNVIFSNDNELSAFLEV